MTAKPKCAHDWWPIPEDKGGGSQCRKCQEKRKAPKKD